MFGWRRNLRIPTVHSYGVNNARANRREIADIVESWEADGLGIISTVEQSELFFTFNDKARGIAKVVEKELNRKSFSDWLASDKFQKVGNLGISLLSFLVSIGALAVSILAYYQTGS